ncbi:hypothetical protein CQ018_06560 [Arthrobacter sp. MYb227]|uniref:GerMN domain-containing protein n=1 Tax=Arthrobacter sp. MYb227 TaxID=1848601 RepID=UPI000CFAAFB2|nr:GerMN domain-containing protein [Arthrobacter sp. MYb227]PQZ94993.1 hypothetical protein CQ018_06560 [Arthrobacter sp. MYb227]
MLQNPETRRSLALVVALAAGISLSACSSPEPAPTPGISSTAPSSSSAPEPSASPTNTQSSAPTSNVTQQTTAALTIFYVAVDDQGKSGPKIGCGDSLVATESAPETFTNQVEASLKMLLNDKSSEHGQSGLVNALAASDLRFIDSTISGDEVAVDLSGSVSSGGTCDDPRIIEQLKYTAKVAAGVGSARILVDGIDIEKILSQK